jgi:hypothetical protein
VRDRTVAKSLLVVAVSAVVVAALVWTIVRDKRSEPYAVPRASLSGWTVVAGQDNDPWTVGLRPPDALATSLFRQIKEKSRLAIVAPIRAAMPLVLRAEYEDALQGVYGVDTLMRFAGEDQIERAAFEPTCIAHRLAPDGAELFFVAFTSPAFYQLRDDFVPPQPEHGGIGVYDPAALAPLLPVAATVPEIGRWFPLAFDPPVDCEALLNTN